MSKGPGVWERRLLRATSGTVIAPVAGIVKTSVVAPDRSDYTSARRAAKSLAVKSQVAAFHAWTRPECFRVQDRSDPQPCCIRPRAMLAVARPERRHLLVYPAPAPSGSAPRWLSVAHPAPVGLPAPTLDDVAQLALRTAYGHLEAGTASVNLRDLAALLRLAHEVEREHHAGRPNEHWAAAVKELLWVARSHLRDGWPALVSDVKANATLRDLWPRPGPGP